MYTTEGRRSVLASSPPSSGEDVAGGEAGGIEASAGTGVASAGTASSSHPGRGRERQTSADGR